MVGSVAALRPVADSLEAACLVLQGRYVDRMLTVLLVEADAAGEIDWNVSVDSTVSRVHQHGATAARLELKPTSHTGGSIELQEIAS